MQLGEEIVLLAKDKKRRTHLVIKCDHCHLLFPKIKKHVSRSNNHFCSLACRNKFRITKVVVKCQQCGKSCEKHPSKIRDNIFCSRKCKEFAQSYEGGRSLICGEEAGLWSYRIKAFAIYGRKCEWCSEQIESLLDVHHIDHNRANNADENLIVLCVRCHAAETRKLVSVVNRLPVSIQPDGKLIIEQIGKKRSN